MQSGFAVGHAVRHAGSAEPYREPVLILVRHGQTAANVRGLLLGRADPPLTAVGLRQAAALAHALPHPARIVSSPLQRAMQTAAAFSANSNTSIDVDDRWIEMDYGALDGVPVSSVPEPIWQRWQRDPHFVPAGGEALDAVGRRVRNACTDIAAEAAQSDIVVVSHVSPIKAAVAWALGVGDEVAWRMFLDDAAVCQIDTRGPVPRLTAFNRLVAVHAAPIGD
jgi:broad specificity phosphatase PhoE